MKTVAYYMGRQLTEMSRKELEQELKTLVFKLDQHYLKERSFETHQFWCKQEEARLKNKLSICDVELANIKKKLNETEAKVAPSWISVAALLLISVAILAGCTATPYDNLVLQVKQDVQYVHQGSGDQHVYGCKPQGDCDDRALCLACRLVGTGASPDDITLVIQGWGGAHKANHMSVEYNGFCLAGYGSTAYQGKCEHPLADKGMGTYRQSLTNYLKHNNVKRECV